MKTGNVDVSAFFFSWFLAGCLLTALQTSCSCFVACCSNRCCTSEARSLDCWEVSGSSLEPCLPSAPGETHFKATNRLLKVFLFVFSASVLLPVTHAAWGLESAGFLIQWSQKDHYISEESDVSFLQWKNRIDWTGAVSSRWIALFLLDCMNRVQREGGGSSFKSTNRAKKAHRKHCMASSPSSSS